MRGATKDQAAGRSGVQPVPGPAWHRQARRDNRVRCRIDQHLIDRPLHVGTQRRAELGIIGQACIVSRADEAFDKAAAEVCHVAVARVQLQHRRLVATRLRVPGRSTHDLCPVGGQPLDVLGMLSRMGERMVQFGVVQAPGVVCPCQGEKGRLATGEFEQGGTHDESIPQRGAPSVPDRARQRAPTTARNDRVPSATSPTGDLR